MYKDFKEICLVTLALFVKEIDDLAELIRKAKEYDKSNDQPHCEDEEKINAFKKIIQNIREAADKEADKKIQEALDRLSKELDIV